MELVLHLCYMLQCKCSTIYTIPVPSGEWVAILCRRVSVESVGADKQRQQFLPIFIKSGTCSVDTYIRIYTKINHSYVIPSNSDSFLYLFTSSHTQYRALPSMYSPLLALGLLL